MIQRGNSFGVKTDGQKDGVLECRYDRSNLTAGILHFGVGNFHRAHQAMYLDRLHEDEEASEWGIVGASAFKAVSTIYTRLKHQNFLYSVVEQSAASSEARVVGSMINYIEPGDSASILRSMENPNIRIVSLTITEGGYFICDDTGDFDVKHPDIIHDSENIREPKTVFGLIVAGLMARKYKGIKPFTIMSCDNIPHNGVVVQNAVVRLARMVDPELAGWIEKWGAFPNSMVDRITPATGEREQAVIRSKFCLEDDAPVFCEDYTQWVLEDDFSLGRPALEKVGVQFVQDVSPYETVKIRILNGGHALIAYPSGLLDIEYVHQAMGSKLLSGFMRKVELDEVIPNLPSIPDLSLENYLAKVIERFSNPKIQDTVRRICLDGSNRQPKFIIPSIQDCIDSGRSYSGLALESALWCRYCYGYSEAGVQIEANDPNWDSLNQAAKRAKTEPSHWLSQGGIYGDLARQARFVELFNFWLNKLWQDGTEETLEYFMSEGDSCV